MNRLQIINLENFKRQYELLACLADSHKQNCRLCAAHMECDTLGELVEDLNYVLQKLLEIESGKNTIEFTVKE